MTRQTLVGLALALWMSVSSAARARGEETRDESPHPPRERFELLDVFGLEFASDPRISPSGDRVVYVRNSMDVMTDSRASDLWILDVDGSNHRPLVTGKARVSSPRWSPDGKRILYVSGADGSSQIHVRWLDTGQTAKLTNLTAGPSGLSWSPDGKSIAFSMRVAEPGKPFAELPSPPRGAEWAPPARVIRKLTYRRDGSGYIEDGYHHLFVLPAEGGTPRQVTGGSFHHRERPVWSPDGSKLYFSANRRDDWDHEPRDTEIYSLSLEDLSIEQLTRRKGPDRSPVISPDGRSLAYLGYDDRYQGYQVTRLHLLDLEGGEPRLLTEGLDRAVRSPVWSADGKGIYFSYSDKGNTKVAFHTLSGELRDVADNLGGTSLGRPYGGGSFTVAPNGTVAFTHTRPRHPADVAIARDGSVQRITLLNEDLLGHKELGAVQEIWFRSSHDRRRIQGWLVKPPGFDPMDRYPLILEIHGGPFADYGDRFAAEIQLYAAAGALVLYINPRGSSSYGEKFGNLIHHNYPGEDYDDLMSGVDAVLTMGFVDEKRLFVTGGSGGGVLTAWIVGKTDRFRAAVVAKPVINWVSFALTADMYNVFAKYWFPGLPWEVPDHYFKRSPLSLVGNVSTPTMLLTGEEDYRTPIAESEQFYQALKLRNVDTALVRIPGASHGIARRPSQLISKVAHILKWFEIHGMKDPSPEGSR